MIGVFSVQLPFSVCLVWLAVMLLKRAKSYSDRLLTVFFLFSALYFYCEASHLSPVANYHRLVVLDLISQFASLAVFPVICIYIRSLSDDTPAKGTSYMLYLPAVLLTTASLVVTCLLGLDLTATTIKSLDYMGVYYIAGNELQNAYQIMSLKSYVLAIVFSGFLALTYIVYQTRVNKFKFRHIVGFLRGRKPSLVSNVVCLFFIILFFLVGIKYMMGRLWLIEHSGWTAFLFLGIAFSLFMIGYVSAIPSLPGGYMDMTRLLHPFDVMHESRTEYLQSIDSGPIGDQGLSGYNKLAKSFDELIVKNQGFLNPSLSIEDVASELSTNRTYVSKLVNIEYGMPFRDYLNKLRLDFAKQLITDEPDASMDYIAAKSGFQSATQFIRKFRTVEGVTPTVWKQTPHTKK